MDLRQRLARLDRLSQPPTDRPPGAEVPFEAVASSLELACDTTDAGDLWSREVRRPDVVACAGPVPDLAGILPAAAPSDLQWSDLLLVDTETTGLMGGTGTLAFLVGLAWWSPDGFTVRQLFLPGPGREGPVLAELARLAATRRVVATYNGASFDLPLLRTRARMNRRADPFADLVSWDLLVGARRLWRHRLADCRQQTIERFLRGTQRGAGDVDGALIPAIYQRYLVGGDVDDLPRVLRHNRRDMDGMAWILAALAAEATRIAGAPTADEPWSQIWPRALVCERRRDAAGAARWARRLADLVDSMAVGPAPVLDAIRLLKRVADWATVARAVTAALGRWPDEPALHYEAAVLYEHRLRDPARALPHARALGDPHRIARLESRLSATDGCPVPVGDL